jgi:alanine dehydrogenase
MENRISIGFPLMHAEPGEKRVFLPGFIQKLTQIGFEVFLEEGYGNSLDFSFDDYKKNNPYIHSAGREETFQKDYVLILRSPAEDEYPTIAKNSCLISMLHYPTRPSRVALIQELGLKTISLDSIVDDFNTRLVENMKSVAWNGVDAAFSQFSRNNAALLKKDNTPWNCLVIGSGVVGKYAVDAASKFGRRERNALHMQKGGAGVIVRAIGRNLTSQPKHLIKLLETTDVLVDATQRYNPSEPIIRNEWLSHLPQHATIVDLSVDPYTLDTDPPVVKGIEGIPQGNLDKYVFEKDDPQWDETIPAGIPTDNRRRTVSCYAWPGIHPEACMRHYGQQIRRLMRVLHDKSYDTLSSDGLYFERALYRARVENFIQKQHIS